MNRSISCIVCLLILIIPILTIIYLVGYYEVPDDLPGSKNHDMYLSVRAMGTVQLKLFLGNSDSLEIITINVSREDNIWTYNCKYGIVDEEGKYVIKKYTTTFKDVN